MLPEQDQLIETLMELYFRKLIIYAEAVLEDPTVAQDVVQDTFHEAVIHINILMTHENPGGWLMNVLKNKIREYRRARNRYIRRFISLDTDLPTEPAASPSSQDGLELSEPDSIPPIERIKAKLTAEEYQLLKRFVFDKASHLVIAKELDITVYASQKRLERIRKKLYEEFPDRKKKKRL